MMKQRGFNWFYGLIGLILLAMLFITVRYFRGTGHSSIGITQGNEFKIRSEKSALVKTIHVVPGQQVTKGTVLIELTSQELDINIDRLESRVATLRAELADKQKVAAAEVDFVKAEQQVEIEKVNSELLEAESELKLNKKLSESFISKKDSTDADSPMLMKIKALRQQRTKLEEVATIKAHSIIQRQSSEQALLTNQIRLLEKELDLLRTESASLTKTAAADGVVGNVYVKEGEQVDAFTSLLSVNTIHPNTVVGYLVGEKVLLPIGAEVSVRSSDRKLFSSDGKVIGYGAVVELPGILQRSTAVKAFGREVFIELDPQNEFAPGEKVLIR